MQQIGNCRRVSDDGSLVIYDLTSGVDFSNPKLIGSFIKNCLQQIGTGELYDPVNSLLYVAGLGVNMSGITVINTRNNSIARADRQKYSNAVYTLHR